MNDRPSVVLEYSSKKSNGSISIEEKNPRCTQFIEELALDGSDDHQEETLTLQIMPYDEDGMHMDALKLFQKENPDFESWLVFILSIPIGKSGGGYFGDTKTPQHVGDGTLKGIKNIAGGVGLGIAGLFALPAAMTKAQGTKGFFKGCGLGLGAAVVFPIAGACTGVMQIGKGLINTPNAIVSSSKGKKWDADARKWVERTYFDLKLSQADGEFLYTCLEWCIKSSIEYILGLENGEIDDNSPSHNNSGGQVLHTGYYDLLNVPVDANHSDIKKAYYKLAKDEHPDKVKAELLRKEDAGDLTLEKDPVTGEFQEVLEATQRFAQIAKAYGVLADPEKRQKYNLEGDECVDQDGVGEDDVKLLMNFMFSSHELLTWAGDSMFETEDWGLRDWFANEGSLKWERQESAILYLEEMLRFKKKLHPMHGPESLFVEIKNRQMNTELAIQLKKRLDPCVYALMKQHETETGKSIPTDAYDTIETLPEKYPSEKNPSEILELWETNMKLEIEALLTLSVGPWVVKMMGFEYHNIAQQKLGHSGAKFQNQKRRTQEKKNLLSTLYKATNAERDLKKHQKKQEMAQIAYAEQKAQSQALNANFRLNLLHYRKQIEKACDLMLKDGCDITQKHRALALQRLGSIMKSSTSKLTKELSIDWVEAQTDAAMKMAAHKDENNHN